MTQRWVGVVPKVRGPMAGLQTVQALWLVLAAMLLLLQSGCTAYPYQKANVLIPDAHGGGHSLAISPDSSRLSSGSWSGRISIWRLPDGEHQYGWQAHAGDVTGLSYVGSGRLLSAGFDGRLIEWAPRGKILNHVETGSPVTAMAVDVIRQMVLTGHADGRLQLRPISGLSPARILGRHEGRVRAVAIAPDGESFASSATDGTVKIWTLDGRVTDLVKPGSDARTLVFSPQGRQLYGAGWFHLFRWDLRRGELATLDTDHYGIINSILFDPEGRYLASISRQTDSSVLFLDPRNGRTIRRFQSHKLCGGVVVISSDGRTMATTSDDASVMIWQLEAVREPEAAAGYHGS